MVSTTRTTETVIMETIVTTDLIEGQIIIEDIEQHQTQEEEQVVIAEATQITTENTLHLEDHQKPTEEVTPMLHALQKV